MRRSFFLVVLAFCVACHDVTGPSVGFNEQFTLAPEETAAFQLDDDQAARLPRDADCLALSPQTSRVAANVRGRDREKIHWLVDLLSHQRINTLTGRPRNVPSRAAAAAMRARVRDRSPYRDTSIPTRVVVFARRQLPATQPSRTTW